jgi:AAA ATPase containing von Willebrand factor type A (vWA) domain
MFDLNNPNHVDESMGLLYNDESEDPTENEDLGEESDIDEVEQNIDSSSTEQDDDDLSSDEEDSSAAGMEFYLGRDKETKWNKKPQSKKRCTQSYNINTHLPGVKGNAHNIKPALECWGNLFTNEILKMIVTYTNQYMDTTRYKFCRERDIRDNDVLLVYCI